MPLSTTSAPSRFVRSFNARSSFHISPAAVALGVTRVNSVVTGNVVMASEATAEGKQIPAPTKQESSLRFAALRPTRTAKQRRGFKHDEYGFQESSNYPRTTKLAPGVRNAFNMHNNLPLLFRPRT